MESKGSFSRNRKYHADRIKTQTALVSAAMHSWNILASNTYYSCAIGAIRHLKSRANRLVFFQQLQTVVKEDLRYLHN